MSVYHVTGTLACEWNSQTTSKSVFRCICLFIQNHLYYTGFTGLKNAEPYANCRSSTVADSFWVHYLKHSVLVLAVKSLLLSVANLTCLSTNPDLKWGWSKLWTDYMLTRRRPSGTNIIYRNSIGYASVSQVAVQLSTLIARLVMSYFPEFKFNFIASA